MNGSFLCRGLPRGYTKLYSHLGWVSSFKLAQFGPHELHDFVYGIGHGYAGIGKSC